MPTPWMKTAAAVVALSGLAACGSPYGGGYRNAPPPAYGAYPSAGGYPATYPPGQVVAPAAVEYGQVAHIEWLQGRAAGQTSGAGAVIGAVVGGVLGNQIGGGTGRAAATAVGAIGGAVAGNAIESRQGGSASGGMYRVIVRLDRGGQRAYDVPQVGDLRVGDRVQVQGNGQISRY